MQAREFWNSRSGGLGAGETQTQGAAVAATTGMPPVVAAAPLGSPAIAAMPHGGKPYLWLAGAAVAGALLTWFVMKHKEE